MAKGDLMLDTAKNGVTIEGVGNDATLNGFGLVMKNCSNVEVRNLGFMNCNSRAMTIYGFITVTSSMAMPVQMLTR